MQIEEIMTYKKDMDDNKLCMVVLQNLVINYLYMFDISFKEKGQICSTLGINMQQQEFIDAASRNKKQLKER